MSDSYYIHLDWRGEDPVCTLTSFLPSPGHRLFSDNNENEKRMSFRVEGLRLSDFNALAMRLCILAKDLPVSQKDFVLELASRFISDQHVQMQTENRVGRQFADATA